MCKGPEAEAFLTSLRTSEELRVWQRKQSGEHVVESFVGHRKSWGFTLSDRDLLQGFGDSSGCSVENRSHRVKGKIKETPTNPGKR